MPPVTLIVNVPPAQVGTATLPSLDAVQVESVYAVIDATAGGPVTPELLVADPSGQVIATKRQSDSIPAGDTGSATWALRLSADGAGATPSVPGMHVIYDYAVTAVGGQQKLDTFIDGPDAGLLPQTFTSLRVTARLKLLQGALGSGIYATIRLNNNTNPNLYDFFWADVQGNPGAVLLGGAATAQPWIAPIPGGPAGQGPYGTLVMDLPWYADASVWQSATWTAGNIVKVGATIGEVATAVGQFRLGVGITRIALDSGNIFTAFDAGSRLTIFAG